MYDHSNFNILLINTSYLKKVPYTCDKFYAIKPKGVHKIGHAGKGQNLQ